MKKRVLSTSAVSIFFIVFTLYACKKNSDNVVADYTCTACKTMPDAIPANDASSKGIYKGIVIGSSGTISFNIANNASTITAVMTIDGTTVNLSSNVTWVQGQAYVAPFTGVLNGGNVTINFKVDANGGNPVITSSDIPGHANASFTLVKETSAALIECFEGTYHTTLPEDGTFNLLLSRTLKLYGGRARKNGAASSTSFNGSINANNDLVDAQNNQVMGHLSSDMISGTFKDGNGSTVTISAKRTF